MLCRIGLTLLFILYVPASLAQDLRLTPDYLAGTWSMSGPEGCAGRTDYATFHANGTLELGTQGRARVVGFWQAGDSTLLLHMLVAPVAGQEGHPFYQSSYYYQYRAADIMDVSADEFTVGIGDALEREQLRVSRCRQP